MRVLFLFLLLLNLGYFGWHWQQQAAPLQSTGAIPVAPGAKTLVLLNEAGAAAGAAAATAPRNDTLQETPPAAP